MSGAFASQPMLMRMLIALAVVVALIVLSWALTVAITGSARRRERRLLDAAMKEVAALITPGQGTPRTNAVRALPFELRVQLFRDLVPLFTRDELRKVRAVLHGKDLVARAEKLARSRAWWRRLRGLRVLTMLAEPVKAREEWFRDPRLEVRAQAAEWAAASGQMDALPLMISMLGDPVGLCRFTVQDSLYRFGALSEAPLARYIARTNGSAVKAALEIAATFTSPAIEVAVLQHKNDEAPEIRRLVARALGSFAGERVAKAVIELLEDPAAEVRAAAARSAGKLRLWTQTKRLAEMLTDRSWEARSAAAVALISIGAPGVMTLRAAMKGTDRFGREIAQQALQIGAIEERS